MYTQSLSVLHEPAPPAPPWPPCPVALAIAPAVPSELASALRGDTEPHPTVAVSNPVRSTWPTMTFRSIANDIILR